MPLETTPFDPAKYLDTPEALAAFLEAALETRDRDYIAHALAIAARSPCATRVSESRRAYRIEDLPADLAAMLEVGLDELCNGVPEEGDNVIG